MTNLIDYTIPSNVRKYIQPPYRLPKSKKGCHTFPLKATNPSLFKSTPPLPTFDQGSAIASALTNTPALNTIPATDFAPVAGSEVVGTETTPNLFTKYLSLILVAAVSITLGIYIYEIQKQAQERKGSKS